MRLRRLAYPWPFLPPEGDRVALPVKAGETPAMEAVWQGGKA